MTDAAPTTQTDTPLNERTYPPPSRLEQWKGFLGDLARPFAIIVTAVSASAAGVIVATKVESGTDGALVMGAIYAGLGALYGFKSWEAGKATTNAANVEIAKATTPTT